MRMRSARQHGIWSASARLAAGVIAAAIVGLAIAGVTTLVFSSSFGSDVAGGAISTTSAISTTPPTSASTPTPNPASTPTDVTALPVPVGAPPSAPLTYTVVPGDNLSKIALWFQLHGYGALYEANKAVIGDNPDLIYPGQRITISNGGMTVG